jgi:F-type H+-transporting ATPase subunit gamma
MASLRDIRNRIGATKNTKQITSAMKMVSAAKLRRATEAATNARPYQQMLTATLHRVAAAAGDIEDEPLLSERPVKKVRVIVLASDRGLCGGFNGTLNRRTEEFIRARIAEGKTVEVYTYGKKARDYMKVKGLPAAVSRTDIKNPVFQAEVTALGTQLAADFVNEVIDEAWLAYNLFKSTMTQTPTFVKVVPLTLEKKEEGVGTIDYRYEPTGPEILSALLPLYLRTVLLQAFLETEAGEHAARMTAMDAATRNASELIKSLTLEYNRGRQAAITKELIEIVSGAEAL